MKATFENSLHNALGGMSGGPRPLSAAVAFYAQQDKVKVADIEREIARRLPLSPNDEARKLLNRQLNEWDFEPDAPWTAGTPPHTPERRRRVYELLQIGKKLQGILDEYIPAWPGIGNILVDNPDTPKDWYTFEFRRSHNFYWKRIRTFLETVRGIPDGSLASLDAATTEIVERLADPASVAPRGGRGLVVGYVQSGKTTNFTGVVAKAIDAGYRLIIVLSGTTNLLRDQTQRRLDMDLVGRENILRGADESEHEHDYKDDPDWPSKFISYGKMPSLLGHIDITRLTGAQDFEGHSAGLNPLEFEFEKKNKLKPLYDRENLDHAGARIIVVKKNPDRLKQLVRDLRSVGTSKCAEIPALIIDDESDQASLNTINPAKNPSKKRSSINGHIVQILQRLPRAQYVGYTATPFANVFVDPTDPADLYPRDFILSLDRPIGYMGAREFHDFDTVPAGRLTNEKAYVCAIPKTTGSADDRLAEAIDAFVLTGALKKYREKAGNVSFKHHTMLFHTSSFKADQISARQAIRSLWRKAAYDSPGSGMTRLKGMLEDFRTVWQDRGKSSNLRFPKTFEELKPALGAALSEMRRGDPVLMINSDDDADVPQFEAKEGVWKIFVGGAKLSRGYTIQGLTVSYFYRAARLQDTLMQMGRWFGFREGYQDLVRLFIGRSVPVGPKVLDLYKAFESMCRDEEDFREQLATYAGKSGITPLEVPALVFNSHPQLRPTARNKMFKAEITWAAFSYREPTSQSAAGAGRKSNEKLFKELLQSTRVKQSDVKGQGKNADRISIKWSTASHKDVLSVLKKVSWDAAGSGIKAEIQYLSGNECPVDSWVLVMPQVGDDPQAGVWHAGKDEFNCIFRTRFATRFNVFSTPTHVKFAKWLVGGNDIDFDSPQLNPKSRTGVMLLYPTKEIEFTGKKASSVLPVMGFGLALPATASNVGRKAFKVKM
ncbi:Z1 domain-containing protein [Bradyrhizobium tropiciagri]|uniref:Z1 domain-containing protein n=1 Tax=Bradyrhizobium tropiciagri TaxID=312253 RepID=UPI00067C4874|nr:Z1 domain-containing protein [Bradyrhizobium tropiciagri]